MNDSDTTTALAGTRQAAFLRDAVDFAGARAGAVLLLMLATAALEGVGLMLLVPLLALVGIGDSRSGVSAAFAEALATIGMNPSLGVVLTLYVALMAVHALLMRQRDLATARLHHRFVDHLRMRLYRAIGAARWSFLAHTRSAEFTHTLTGDLARVSLAVHSLLQLATGAVLAAAYLVVALGLSLPATLSAVAIGALLLALLHPFSGIAQRLGGRLTHSQRALLGDVSEFLAGLKLAKSYNAEEVHAGRFGERLAHARDANLQFVRSQAVARVAFRVGGALALAAVVYVTLELLTLPTATILVLVAVFARLMPQLSQLQQSYQRIRHALPAYDAYRDMLERCRAAAEPPREETGYRMARDVALQGVRYRHSADGEEALRGVDLVLPRRCTTALIGPSGAGKSTIADIVTGLLRPTAGELCLDGAPVEDLRAWRDAVAYVPQETFLFHASVRDNLRWARPDADEAALWEALDAAAADFVRDLPHGLDSVVGERGIRLSGGERQRLAIARALLRRPQVLVLDEATSALDRGNELRIQQALDHLHGHLTILVIAHRLATVRSADQVAVVERGRVVESGSYAELAGRAEGYLAREGVTTEG